MQEKWLVLFPLGHSKHSKALGQYAKTLGECYHQQGNMTDLTRSIEIGEKILDLCPTDHPQHGIALNDLAVAINARYQKLGDLMDLNKTINLQEQYLKLCPSGHLYHGIALHNLALSLRKHYRKIKDYFDLMRSVKLLKEALHTYPVHHPRFALVAGSLTSVILLSLNSHHPLDQLLPSVDKAFETYRLLKQCAPAASLFLLQAVQAWVQDAEKYNHSSVLEAYQTTLTTLDHFTSLNSSLDSRHETMQARVADLANDAFSCATRHGDFQIAVELLEQGRGILWNQLAHFDISIALLEGQGNRGHELGKKFTRLSANLRKHAQGSGEKGTDPYWRTREEWQVVVDEIRHLDGFSRFLLPPYFDDLQHAAEYGPVIIVNASKYTCDALIVLGSRSPVRVSLPCSLAEGLIRTRERVRAQREVRNAAGFADAPTSFAAVGQARPSADIKLSELVEVEHEIKRIRDETCMPQDSVTFETVTGEAATIEGAVQAFRDHHWVHVACHGAQHATKPFDSWFAMGDGKLTLMRIIQERYTNSEFAFLSACHTAVGDASTPDEVLHLAAGMQFAGFNGVIGTLWKVDDAVAHRLVTRFYQEMFKRPTIDFEHAGAALNTAAVESADEVSLEKRIVFVHIGI